MKCFLFFSGIGLLAAPHLLSQNIAVNSTGAAAVAANMFEVTQPATAPTDYVSIFAKNLSTGTNAYAVWAEATGATNKYAIVVPSTGGSVGIGTITPGAKLDVVYAGPISSIATRILHSGNAGSPGSALSISNGYPTSSASGSYEIFGIYANSFGTSLTSLRDNGNMGIGTSSPSVKLHVFSSADEQPEIRADNNNATGLSAGAVVRAAADAANVFMMSHGSARTLTRYGITLGGYSEITNWNGGNGLIIGSSLTAPIIFGTANLERMRLLGNGTLKTTATSGTSPGIWMESNVTAAAGTAYGILSRGTLTASANNESLLSFSSSIGVAATGTYTGLTFYGAHIDANSWTKTGTGTINNGYGLYVTTPTIGSSNYAGIFTGGNVGIGITTPSEKVDVYGGAGNGRAQISVSSPNPIIYLTGDATNGYYPSVDFKPQANSTLGGTIQSYSTFGGLNLNGRGGPNVSSQSDASKSIFQVLSQVNNHTANYLESKYVNAGNFWLTSSLTPVSAADQRIQLLLYNTLETGPTNYERLALYADATNNIFRIESQKGGTGTLRSLALQPTQGNVGIGTTAPSAKALVEMNSTSTGVLIPRMTNAQRTTVAPGAAANQGLLIYQTDIGTTAPTGIGFYYWDGAAWTGIGSNTSGASSSSINYSSNMIMQDEFIGDYLQVAPWISDATCRYSTFALGWSRNPIVSTTFPTAWGENGTSTINHPGVTKMKIGNTGANQYSSLYLNNSAVDARSTNFVGAWIINITSNALSTAAGAIEEYNLKVGLMSVADWRSTSTGNPAEGIFFETTANNGLWYGTTVKTSGGAGTTKTSTTIPPSLNTWRRLEIRSDAAGTTWYFYVDGTLRVTTSTNIPVSGTLLSPGFKIVTGASGLSTTTPEISVDYFYMAGSLSR